MDTKVCFKCGIDKPISDFYKHPKMSDGHLGKCKECAKNDVHEKYKENIQNEEYVEKERKRGRDKYKRLSYNDKYKYIKRKAGSNTRRFLKCRGIEMTNKEVHHWNYNLENDIFILSRRAHSLIHKYIVFDDETKMFKRKSDLSLIKTKDEHFLFIKAIFIKNGVNYEIDSYPTIID